MKTAEPKSKAESTHSWSSNSRNEAFFHFNQPSTDPFFCSAQIQPKLKIGEPGDQYEKQADRVADAVVQMPDSTQTVQRQTIEEEMLQTQLMEEEEELQMKREPILQRKCKECEEESIQKKSSDSAKSGNSASDAISTQLQSNNGSGNHLSHSIQSEMSHKIGADFSSVNIHTDSKAVQMNQALGARAFTHGNNIYFNSGEFRPKSTEGKRLLAHELTHVLQQNNGISKKGNLIQCELAIPPQGSGQERGLSQIDITSAIQFNERKFTDPYSLKTIRDVIGIPQYPAVSDEVMAKGVARWQADHGIAQDGKVGVVTLLTILEELEAEGQDRDAQLLRADFQWAQSNMLDIDSSHCGCENELQSEIAESQDFINVYQQCGADPSVNSGAEVEDCVTQYYASRGISLSTAGSTDSSGTTSVASQPGPCGPLLEMATRAHEQVHSVHVRELRQQYGSARAFNQVYDDSQDWVEDEVNSRETDIAFARYMISVLNNICSLSP